MFNKMLQVIIDRPVSLNSVSIVLEAKSSLKEVNIFITEIFFNVIFVLPLPNVVNTIVIIIDIQVD